MDPLAIIKKHYAPECRAYRLLTDHSRAVAEKAIRIAERLKHLNPDCDFIYEAAMLHDIGIFLTNEPGIGCHGNNLYIGHGYLGRELLDKEGYPLHALVCERHVGVGISLRDIEEKNLPLPKRDMLPMTIEEKIICFSDKFFSKDAEFLLKEKPLEKVMSSIMKFGEDKLERFNEWMKVFGE